MKPQEIGNGLVMRNATAEDIPGLLDHWRTVHGSAVVDMLGAMLEHHPRFSWKDSFIVSRPNSAEIISCAILLRNAWKLAGITFLTVEMEAVGTLEQYRNRGLMWRLNEAFEKRSAEIQPAFQAIAGIPYFYKNFGYEYAAKLGGGYPVAAGLVPEPSESEKRSIRFEEVDIKSFEEFLRYRSTHLSSEPSQKTWQRDLNPKDSAYLLFRPTSEE